jgi:hypothetical protein
MKKVSKKVTRKPKGRQAGSTLDAYVFCGNGDQDPETITMHGYTFELNGKPVKVSKEASAKLSTNTHFK